MMTISLAERPHDVTGQLPSEDYLRKVAAVFATSNSEKIALTRSLLMAKALYTLPREVADFLRECSEGGVSAVPGQVAEPFRARLARDLEHYAKTHPNSHISPYYDELMAVAKGHKFLSRQDVINAAVALKQKPDTYLYLAEYMTDVMLAVLENIPLSKVISKLIHCDSKVIKSVVHITDEILRLAERDDSKSGT